MESMTYEQLLVEQHVLRQRTERFDAVLHDHVVHAMAS